MGRRAYPRPSENGPHLFLYNGDLWAIAANTSNRTLQVTGARPKRQSRMLGGFSLNCDSQRVPLRRDQTKSAALPHERIPLGHGKANLFWSLLSTIVIFGIARVFFATDGFRFSASRNHHQAKLEILQFRLCRRFRRVYSWLIASRIAGSTEDVDRTLWRLIRAAKISVFTVFIEDPPALGGIAIAALGIAWARLQPIPIAIRAHCADLVCAGRVAILGQ